MNEKIKELKELQNKQKLYILLFVIYMLCMLYVTYRKPVVGLVMHLLGFLFYIFYVMKHDRKFKNRIKQYTLEEGLRPYLKNITYIEKNGVDKDTLEKTGFIPCSDYKSLISRDTITAAYKNSPVILTDLVSMVDSKIPNKKGEPVNGKEHLIGVYFDIKSDKISGPEFTLWPKKELPEEIQWKYFDKESLSTEIHEFQKGYNLYISSGDAGDISPDLVKSIIQLSENTTGAVACQMTEGNLRFFIIHRFMYNLNVSFKAPITPQLLNLVSFPEIAHIIRVVDSVM